MNTPFRTICLIFILRIFIPGKVLAQAQSFTSIEYEFVKHLFLEKYYNEANLYLNAIKVNELNTAGKDTLYYLKGVAAYYQKSFDSSANACLKVPDSLSISGQKARILAAYSLLMTQKERDVKFILKKDKFSKTEIHQFSLVENASAALIKRDTAEFRKYADKFSENGYITGRVQEKLLKEYENFKPLPHKSPMLAGIVSAVLPGLGEFYAGRRGQAVSNFIACTLLGLQTWESWHKVGLKSPYLYAYGSLFTLFYTANIYGGVHAAILHNREKNEAYRTQILFDLHLPLRNLLDL